MKKYICKYCKKEGTRKDIRKHLKEKHVSSRGLGKDNKGESKLTQAMLSEEIGWD